MSKPQGQSHFCPVVLENNMRTVQSARSIVDNCVLVPPACRFCCSTGRKESMKAENQSSTNDKNISRILWITLVGLLNSGGALAVNVTIPTTLIKGSVGGEALLSVRYVSFSLDLPVIKWQLKREKSVTVVQSIGTDIIGTLRPEYQDRILVFENGTLLLHNLRLTDDGIYDVEISITDDTFTGEGSISLMVYEPISAPHVHTEDFSVLERSENLVLNCSHENGTRVTYHWFKGGSPLTNETRFVLSHDRKLLTIARVMMADDDVYSCTVTNPVSSMSSPPVKLTVYKRSSLYIILSTGGIFLLITLVTICACWTPSKKPRYPTKKLLSRSRFRNHRSLIRHADDWQPEVNGKNAVTSLYILQRKDPAAGDSSSIGSPSEQDNPPPSYKNSPTRR
ncbi:LOW QUALITY PROTEIN: hepatic and glial cell adhesion molecule-like [Neosynchiropus ocellatus]